MEIYILADTDHSSEVVLEKEKQSLEKIIKSKPSNSDLFFLTELFDPDTETKKPEELKNILEKKGLERYTPLIDICSMNNTNILGINTKVYPLSEERTHQLYINISTIINKTNKTGGPNKSLYIIDIGNHHVDYIKRKIEEDFSVQPNILVLDSYNLI